MTKTVKIPARTVVALAVAAEGLLAAAALLWIWLRELVWPSFEGAWAPGLLAALPLLTLNFFLMRRAQRGKWPALKHLLEDAIKPLCAELGPLSAAIVSLSAGIGEELFFRAALNQELAAQIGCWWGISVSSFIFAAVHFLGQFRLYLGLMPLYFAIGLYLSLLVSWQQDLSAAIICHAFYNYAAILYVRYGLQQRPTCTPGS